MTGLESLYIYIYIEHFDKLSHPALKKGETVYPGHRCHHVPLSHIRLAYARPASLLPHALPQPPALGGHTPSPHCPWPAAKDC